jgi:exodeoxyribonuclease VII small subunit
MNAQLPADIADLSFEAALTELETLVRRMESGTVKLDEAVTAYERGMQLRALCASKLEQARLRVEQIAAADTGDLMLASFES